MKHYRIVVRRMPSGKGGECLVFCYITYATKHLFLNSHGHVKICLLESVAEKKKEKELGRPQLRWYAHFPIHKTKAIYRSDDSLGSSMGCAGP